MIRVILPPPSNAPFFKIGADLLPTNANFYTAGEYTVTSLSQGSAAIRIDNAHEAEKGITLSIACQRAQAPTQTTLVFHRLGDNYFLYQIWMDGNSAGRQFRVSKKEVQLAENHSKPELVIVAANISH